MNDIVHLLKNIQEDWALLVFFFTLGGCWWQGQAWFMKINRTLESVGSEHAAQNKSLADLHIKIDIIDRRVELLEVSSEKLHEEVHEAEVQLAVLQNTQDINEAKAVRRPRRKVG